MPWETLDDGERTGWVRAAIGTLVIDACDALAVDPDQLRRVLKARGGATSRRRLHRVVACPDEVQHVRVELVLFAALGRAAQLALTGQHNLLESLLYRSPHLWALTRGTKWEQTGPSDRFWFQPLPAEGQSFWLALQALNMVDALDELYPAATPSRRVLLELGDVIDADTAAGAPVMSRGGRMPD